MTHCPKCHAAVIKKSQDGKIRVRTRIVAFDGLKAEGVCTRCGATIELPLELAKGFLQAMQPARRLMVKSRKLDRSGSPP